MKNIYHKIEFHYTYLILAFGFVITGHFINLIVLTLLILIHELGHFTSAFLLKYKISKIIIYPYGGLTKLETLINTSIIKDFIIAISGVSFQIIFFLIVSLFHTRGIIRSYTYNLFLIYHQSMLLFNLLPIIPLDGSKIMNLILSKFFYYRLANQITVYLSLIVLFIAVRFEVFARNYSTIMIIFVLLKNIYTFYGELDYIYHKFLLERYLYKFNYSKVKIIKNPNKMYKDKKHFFLYHKKIIPEHEFLYHFLYKKQ